MPDSTYAVVRCGGKQYRVEEGTTLLVDRLSGDEGASLDLEPLLYARGKDTLFSADDLGRVKVEARIVGHERGPKLRVFKFKPKRGYRRTSGHRSELTRLEISDIKLLARKPAKASGGAETAAEKKPAAGKGAAGTAKPARKKPASGGKSGSRTKEKDADGS